MTAFSSSPWLLLLGLIPAVHFVLLYVLSKKRGTLKHMFGLYAIKYMDWLFVPFNFLVPVSVTFNWAFAGVTLLLLLVLLVYLHVRWHNIGKDLGRKAYFTDKKGLTPEGWTHFVFMAVQGMIIVTVVLSRATSWWYVVMLACLFVYLLLYILIVRYVRHVALRSKAEFPFIVLGMLAVLVRGLLLWAGA